MRCKIKFRNKKKKKIAHENQRITSSRMDIKLKTFKLHNHTIVWCSELKFIGCNLLCFFDFFLFNLLHFLRWSFFSAFILPFPHCYNERHVCTYMHSAHCLKTKFTYVHKFSSHSIQSCGYRQSENGN